MNLSQIVTESSTVALFCTGKRVSSLGCSLQVDRHRLDHAGHTVLSAVMRLSRPLFCRWLCNRNRGFIGVSGFLRSYRLHTELSDFFARTGTDGGGRTALRLSIVSVDKIACCTFDNAMETGLKVDRGSPSRHTAMTVCRTLKNSRGNPSDSSVQQRPGSFRTRAFTSDSAMVALHAHGGECTCRGLP
jgi:hypothetical protein